MTKKRDLIKEELVLEKVLFTEQLYTESRVLLEAVTPEQLDKLMAGIQEMADVLTKGLGQNFLSDILKDTIQRKNQIMSTTSNPQMQEVAYANLLASTVKLLQVFKQLNRVFPVILNATSKGLAKAVSAKLQKTGIQGEISDSFFSGSDKQIQDLMKSTLATPQDLLAGTPEQGAVRKLLNLAVVNGQKTAGQGFLGRLKGLFQSNPLKVGKIITPSLGSEYLSNPEKFTNALMDLPLKDLSVVATSIGTFMEFLETITQSLETQMQGHIKSKGPGFISKVGDKLSAGLDKFMGHGDSVRKPMGL